MLIELKDGCIKNIETDESSYGGCETCDYGSKYTNEFTVYFENSPRLYVEASQMYDLPLSMDFLMKLFLLNLDLIKTMTEKECKDFIVSRIEESSPEAKVLRRDR